jgi:hypothetical protein
MEFRRGAPQGFLGSRTPRIENGEALWPFYKAIELDPDFAVIAANPRDASRLLRFLVGAPNTDLEIGQNSPRARYAQFKAGFCQAEETVAAIATGVTTGATADLAPRHLTANVIFRSIGVERDLGTLEHHEQLGLLFVQPFEQAVERDEASLERDELHNAVGIARGKSASECGGVPACECHCETRGGVPTGHCAHATSSFWRSARGHREASASHSGQ